MKAQQPTTTSTQQQTSNRSVDEYGYPLYLDAENDPALSKAFADVIDYYAELEAQSPKEAVFHSNQPWVDCPDPWNLRGRLPMTPVWKDPNKGAERRTERNSDYSRVLQFSTGEVSYRRMAPDGYPLYIDPNNDPYSYLKRPNPPTPEAVARAQFVDKTYVWKESSKTDKPS